MGPEGSKQFNSLSFQASCCKWRTTYFRFKKGAEMWPLAAPLRHPWPDSNDPLSGFPVNYARLFWFWSIPMLIPCQSHKMGGAVCDRMQISPMILEGQRWAPQWRQHDFLVKVLGQETKEIQKTSGQVKPQNDRDDFWLRRKTGQKKLICGNFLYKVYTQNDLFSFFEFIKWAFLK